MKIATVVGARPQFIKASAVSRAIEDSASVEEVLIHTGQHFDRNMSDVFFDALSIPPPKYNLGVSSTSHARMTAQMMIGLEEVVQSEHPDWVLVYGDTNSTLAGALAASKLNIPVAHVEAGLRSFNRAMPEEINRIVTDHVSSLLFCPTRTAADQLVAEGMSNVACDGELLTPDCLEMSLNMLQPLVCNVGDVMLDVITHARESSHVDSCVLERLTVTPGAYVLLSVHRQAMTDDREAMALLVSELIAVAHDWPIVFPIHPRTRQAFQRAGLLDALVDHTNIRVVDPVPYLDFIALEANAHVVLTDSGGAQKEAYFLGIPCLTLRDETEWPETLPDGWNRLVGLRPAGLADAVNSAKPASDRTRSAFGHGQSAVTIVAILRQLH